MVGTVKGPASDPAQEAGASPSASGPEPSRQGGAGSPAAADAAAARPRAPPPRAAADFQRHQTFLLLGALLHLVLAVHLWRSGQARRRHAVALALVAAALAATHVSSSSFLFRHRALLLTATRFIGFASPTWREALPPLLLERAAQPGWLGAVKDCVHVMTGTRLLLLVVGGAAAPLPPAATLAVQLMLLHLSSPAAVCCGTQLLGDPLMQQRIRGLATAANCATLPVQLLVAAADPAAFVGPGMQRLPAKECTAALLFLQLCLGLLLPLLPAVYAWHPSAASEGERDIVAMPRVGHLQHLAAPHVAFFRTVRNSTAAGMSKGIAAADGTLHAVLHTSSGAVSRAAGAYLVVSLCWVLCKRLTGVYAMC